MANVLVVVITAPTIMHFPSIFPPRDDQVVDVVVGYGGCGERGGGDGRGRLGSRGGCRRDASNVTA